MVQSAMASARGAAGRYVEEFLINLRFTSN